MSEPMKPMSDRMTEAAEWYWQIREPDVSEAELQEWRCWMSMSPENRHAFDRIENALDGVTDIEVPPWPTEQEVLRDRYDGSESIAAWLHSGGNRRQSSETKTRRSQRSLFHIQLLAAAMVVGSVALGLYMLGDRGHDLQAPNVVAYETAAAEHRDVMLPDGSSVALGGKTRISVVYDAGHRIIELRGGEAYFDVAKDPKRPFEVVAGGRRIVAVGTAFNVTWQAARVTLTVTQGQVIVRKVSAVSSSPDSAASQSAGDDERVARLEAGQRIVFDRMEVEPITFTDEHDPPAWRRGLLKYRGEELRFVIEDVNRYTTKPIRVGDDAAGELLFTGTVFQNSAESWVFGLEDAFPVTIERADNGVTIHSRQP